MSDSDEMDDQSFHGSEVYIVLLYELVVLINALCIYTIGPALICILHLTRCIHNIFFNFASHNYLRLACLTFIPPAFARILSCSPFPPPHRRLTVLLNNTLTAPTTDSMVY